MTPSPSTACPVGPVGFGVSLNSIFEAAMVPSPRRVPVRPSFAPAAMFAHAPRSNVVADESEILYGPTMKLRLGHPVPLTSDDTVTSAYRGVAGGSGVGLVSRLNVRFVTRTKLSPSFFVPTIATLTPGLMSAHAPPLYRVAEERLNA